MEEKKNLKKLQKHRNCEIGTKPLNLESKGCSNII